MYLQSLLGPLDGHRFPFGTRSMPKIDDLIKCDSLPPKTTYLEPFQYTIRRRASLDGETSLKSVFGDQSLVDTIMTSLEIEQFLQHPHFFTDGIITPSSAASKRKGVCFQLPGTFLNKDGKWIKGKPCRVEQCDKRAQSNGLCKGHGGGARCNIEGCNKSSQGGGLCRAHGGGKRCMREGCEKGTQRNGFCYLHGGVRICSIQGCERKDRGNGKCFAHGGGRRCQAKQCCAPIRRGTYCAMHCKRISSLPYLSLLGNTPLDPLPSANSILSTR